MPSKTPQGIFFNDFKTSYIPQILEEIYIKQVYRPFLIGKKDLTIVDWGGNIGLTSYYFKDYARKVYCVEPSQEHADIIRHLLAYNKIDNITLCQYAIAGKNGKTRFYHPENVTMYSMENVMGAKDYEEVETVDPATFMKREKIDHIDLLKLDVEGSEGEVIASEGFKKIAPNIDVICGEWHNWASMSKDVFMNTFRDLGFSFRWHMDTQASVFEAVRL
jgi:FkbM family methyltransferase